MEHLASLIREIPNFPKPGISYKDITPLLASPSGLALSVEMMVNPFRGRRVDIVAGAESRGFIFGAAVAQSLSAGFVPIRKTGKLPSDTHGVDYGLEYGADRVEIHRDAIAPGQRVLMVDDLLATGGTMRACCELVARMDAEIIGQTFLIELGELGGRRRLEPHGKVHAVLRY